MNRAKPRAGDEKTQYPIIGMGSCGTVFEIPGTGLVVKKGQNADALYEDFLMADMVHEAIADT